MDPKARLQYCLNEFAAATGLKLHKNFQLLEEYGPAHERMYTPPLLPIDALQSIPRTPSSTLHPGHTIPFNPPLAHLQFALRFSCWESTARHTSACMIPPRLHSSCHPLHAVPLATPRTRLHTPFTSSC